MPHDPLTKQRSEWQRMPEHDVRFGDVEGQFWFRDVADGRLLACISHEPKGWHLSISWRSHRGQLTRYPSWDEQVHAVRQLLPPGLTYCMLLPPDDQNYVNAHQTTFHWHEFHDDETEIDAAQRS